MASSPIFEKVDALPVSPGIDPGTIYILRAGGVGGGATIHMPLRDGSGFEDAKDGRITDLAVSLLADLVQQQAIVTSLTSGRLVIDDEGLKFDDVLLGASGGAFATFGEFTPPGVGGVVIPNTPDGDYDDFQVVGGVLSKRVQTFAGGPGQYSVNGRIVVLEAGSAHHNANEVEAILVYEALSMAVGGRIKIRDGNDQGSERWTYPTRAFTAPVIIEPENWTENADPRLTIRNCFLPGLSFGKGTENLTIQGFDIYDDTVHGEGEGTTGIVHIPRPSKNITVRQNRIHSRDFVEIWNAGDFADNFTSSRILRGVIMNESSSSGVNENFRIDDNWFHDVARAAYVFRVADGPNGERSSFNRNIVEDVYTNFVTSANFDGLGILDNKCMHVWAADEDTLTPSNQQSIPHSGIAGFDTGSYRGSQRIKFDGNLMHVGWKRTKLHRDYTAANPGDPRPDPELKTTGVKFNDSPAAQGYYDLDIGFNLIVTHGIGLELSACDTVSIKNFTLVGEDYNTNAGSPPSYYFAGASNVEFFNCLGELIDVGALDDTGDLYPKSAISTAGYGYQKVKLSDFRGIPGRGVGLLDELTIDQLEEAYTPVATHHALTGHSKKGALGTGLYSGNGVHNVTYNPPVSTSAEGSELRTFFSDETSYLQTGNAGAPSKGFSVWGTLEMPSGADGETSTLIGATQNRITMKRNDKGALSFTMKPDGDDFTANVISFGTRALLADSTAGRVDFFATLDTEKGVVILAIDGVLEPLPAIGDMTNVNLATSVGLIRIGSDHFSPPTETSDFIAGPMGMMNRFIDIEDPAIFEKVFSSTGKFADHGPDGSLIDGSPVGVYITGDETDASNKGIGTALSVSGALLTTPTGDIDAARLSGTYVVNENVGDVGIHARVVSNDPVDLHVMFLASGSDPAPSKAEIVADNYGATNAPFKKVYSLPIGTSLVDDTVSTVPNDEDNATAYDVFYLAVDQVSGNSGEIISVSFSATATGDLTPPVLASPTASQTGSDTADTGVTTDSDEGTITVVMSSSATVPSGAQVNAGQDHTGAGVVFSTLDVSAAGIKSIPVTGLSAVTDYYPHFVHVDDAGNVSDVASSAMITTVAAPAGETTYPDGYVSPELGPLSARHSIFAVQMSVSNFNEGFKPLNMLDGIGTESSLQIDDDAELYVRAVATTGFNNQESSSGDILSANTLHSILFVMTPNRQEVIVDNVSFALDVGTQTNFKSPSVVNGPPSGSTNVVKSIGGFRKYTSSDSALDGAVLSDVVWSDAFNPDGSIKEVTDIRGVPFIGVIA